LNYNGCIGVLEVFANFGKLANVFTLYTIANPSSAHKDIQGFIERAGAVYGKIGTVVSSYVTTIKGRACRHKSPHARHHFQIVNGIIELILNLWRKDISTYLILIITNKALYGFIPILSALLILKPSSVAALIYKLFITGRERVIHH
jgi:hypothetical protein